MKRFEDKNYEIYDFVTEILIVCPKCSKKAYVLANNDDPRIICQHCGFTRQKAAHVQTSMTVGGPYDPFFQEKLYLQISCCGQILFAFNDQHLSYLKDYVSSQIRERNKEQSCNKNRSLISRLPAWLKSSKNRVEILKKIVLLENKSATT